MRGNPSKVKTIKSRRSRIVLSGVSPLLALSRSKLGIAFLRRTGTSFTYSNWSDQWLFSIGSADTLFWSERTKFLDQQLLCDERVRKKKKMMRKDEIRSCVKLRGDACQNQIQSKFWMQLLIIFLRICKKFKLPKEIASVP
ncbi:hypothetical protein CEXT_26701 [Caerostris extrusa]|uniref:Uncharacterized protein n=1 Tax=Caerostris extrusa TaxID=172846 RepID=A0AAV4XFV5_CAEEX|nr:hypothetical protein CEXT_26701 [Caerostris extrusa]